MLKILFIKFDFQRKYFIYCLHLVSTFCLILKDKGTGGVANAGVLHVQALAALCIFQKFKAHILKALILQGFNGTQHNANRMTTAYRIIIFPQILCKRGWTERLNDVHALLVQLLDALVYGAAGAIVVSVTESLAPMAKIGRYHK